MPQWVPVEGDPFSDPMSGLAMGGQPRRQILPPPDYKYKGNLTVDEAIGAENMPDTVERTQLPSEAGTEMFARAVAPNLVSVMKGEPRPPIENLPGWGQETKVPSTADPRIPEAGFELFGLLPTPGMEAAAVKTGLGAALKAGFGPVVKAAPEVGDVTRGLMRALGFWEHVEPQLVRDATGKVIGQRVEHDPFTWVGTAPIEMHNAEATDFHAAITAHKAAHPHGSAVSVYEPDQYAGMQLFMTPDKRAGFAIKPDGDIISVFKSPDSPYRGAVQSMLPQAIGMGGTKLDAFDTVLPRLYGQSGFRAVARLKWNDLHAPEGWDKAKFAKYNNGEPDVVFMVHDPYYKAGYRAGDGKLVDTYDEALAIQQQAVTDAQSRIAADRANFDKVAQKVEGIKALQKYFTPEEQGLLTTQGARSIMQIFAGLPQAEEMGAIAYSGRAKRGWYKSSAQALVDIFGVDDSRRFVALLAATSPQNGVEMNLQNTLGIWREWKKLSPENRIKREEIIAAMGRGVLGTGGEESVLPAWIENSVRSLTAKDPSTLQISGPKVNSFSYNLRDAVHEVTNDTWMGYYSGSIDAKDFRGVYKFHPKQKENLGGKNTKYLAMNALTRQAAEALSHKTGDVWTPAEIQETVWSWARTLANKAKTMRKGGQDATVEKLLAAGNITHEEIGNTPDFALLFVEDVYAKLLEQAGYGKQLKELRAAGAGRRKPAITGSPLSAKGSTFAQSDFEEHLRRTGRRLDIRPGKKIGEQADE
jgi:hypothetical protein